MSNVSNANASIKDGELMMFSDAPEFVPSKIGIYAYTVWENITNTNDSSISAQIKPCEKWTNAQHAVFQLANLCFLISLLTPYTFKYHSLFLRVMLNVGYVLTLIWASVFVCMSDVVIWSTVILAVNSAHIVYLTYVSVPHRFSKALEHVYLRTFKPLKVTRKQFKGLADLGTMHLQGKGSFYARQKQTPTGHKLSVLLKGRFSRIRVRSAKMGRKKREQTCDVALYNGQYGTKTRFKLKVSYGDVYLHSVDANHFVDSPEYDNFNETYRDGKYKVNISATEDCLLFSFPQDRLIKHLSSDPRLEHIFGQIIGKDISQKLYEIQERMTANPNYLQNLSTRRASMVHVRNSIVSSSTTNLAKLNCLQGDQI
ncbi:blood vessel epicardial substance-A-like isoform X2 [Mya arenaria]|uniref:blood vessel epicardial substance-A-like isoform X2 n=1 Tax=Mya arenaria TaxID=6604 RepID=UPI0022E617ED|nr:blood vessel epicardial substance-A-like isoform X2 [Mya arenaria]